MAILRRKQPIQPVIVPHREIDELETEVIEPSSSYDKKGEYHLRWQWPRVTSWILEAYNETSLWFEIWISDAREGETWYRLKIEPGRVELTSEAVQLCLPVTRGQMAELFLGRDKEFETPEGTICGDNLYESFWHERDSSRHATLRFGVGDSVSVWGRPRLWLDVPTDLLLTVLQPWARAISQGQRPWLGHKQRRQPLYTNRYDAQADNYVYAYAAKHSEDNRRGVALQWDRCGSKNTAVLVRLEHESLTVQTGAATSLRPPEAARSKLEELEQLAGGVDWQASYEILPVDLWLLRDDNWRQFKLELDTRTTLMFHHQPSRTVVTSPPRASYRSSYGKPASLYANLCVVNEAWPIILHSGLYEMLQTWLRTAYAQSAYAY